ncbi:hypothetical protein WJX84_004596 [Apatococcus fuscideae]|uniref:Uncharacterized protein n=1 Tax=Apatococcus fuscideae TaxID=2026836 RepID=A0AAW1T7Z1_9CHLO
MRQHTVSMQRAAATQPEQLAFRRPDVPADSKTSYSDQQHRANTQSFRPSDALAAAGQPRSPLEQASFATNNSLQQRLEEKPRLWGLGRLGF